MKHPSVPSDHLGKSVFDLSGDEIETHVFAELEAQQQMRVAEKPGDVPLFQFPDDRTLLQRLSTWWYLRCQRVTPIEAPTSLNQDTQIAKKPKWPGHWAP